MPTRAEYYKLKSMIDMPDDVTLPGEFDYLDRLEGEAFQAAIDKLTQEQLERYENAR